MTCIDQLITLAILALELFVNPALGRAQAPAPVLLAQAPQPQRVDLFDPKSNRTGHVIVDPKTGRVDIYDQRSNRTGYGTLSPDGKTLELFDKNANRLGSGRVK